MNGDCSIVDLATRARTTRLAAALALAWLTACSADSAPAPEPTLQTSGAFTAAESDAGGLDLFRTLIVLSQGNADEVLFVTQYGVNPSGFDEARQLAQRKQLPVRSELKLLGRDYFDDREWEVVWFRTLTDEEQQSFR